MDDVKSNGEEDGELKLHEARLEFRGSKKEDSEGVVEVVKVGMVAGSKVSAESTARRGEAKRQPLFVTVLCMMRVEWNGVSKKERNSGSEGSGGLKVLEASAASRRADL
jgi:hypothetical protein